MSLKSLRKTRVFANWTLMPTPAYLARVGLLKSLQVNAVWQGPSTSLMNLFRWKSCPLLQPTATWTLEVNQASYSPQREPSLLNPNIVRWNHLTVDDVPAVNLIQVQHTPFIFRNWLPQFHYAFEVLCPPSRYAFPLKTRERNAPI